MQESFNILMSSGEAGDGGELRGNKILVWFISEWSTAVIRDYDVDTPVLLCHKEPPRRIQSPLLGALERKIFCLLLAGSLWHKRKYFSSIKLWTNESQASTIPTNESAPLC